MRGIVEKGLGNLFITLSSFHFFKKTNLEQYLLVLSEDQKIKLLRLHLYCFFPYWGEKKSFALRVVSN